MNIIFKKIILTILTLSIVLGGYVLVIINKNPKSLFADVLSNLQQQKKTSINMRINDVAENSTTSNSFVLNIDTKINNEEKDNLLAQMDIDLEFLGMLFEIESVIIKEDLYLNLKKAGFLQQFLGEDFMNQWIHIDKKYLSNNPIGVNLEDKLSENSTLTDEQKKEKYISFINKSLDEGVINFVDKKFVLENGKLIRKDYFNIDNKKLSLALLDYYKQQNLGFDVSEEEILDIQKDLDSIVVSDAYISTDIFKKNINAVYMKVTNSATDEQETVLTDDNFPKAFEVLVGISNLDEGIKIEKPESSIELETLLNDLMGAQLGSMYDENYEESI